MENASWDDYKKSIKGLSEEQIEQLEKDAKIVAEKLNDKDSIEE